MVFKPYNNYFYINLIKKMILKHCKLLLLPNNLLSKKWTLTKMASNDESKNGSGSQVLQVEKKASNDGQQKKEGEDGPKAKRLVWVDCEMSGLDLENHRLVEIACIVTESDLSVVAEFGPVTIKHPPEVLENMSDWCKETFSKNGLLERINNEGLDEREVEMKVLEFLRDHTPPGKCPLAGNSVHQDARFLRRYMPKLFEQLHPYRIVDVSTLKELVSRWYEKSEALAKMPPKKCTHLALDDIRESIAELEYYRKNFMLA